MNNNAGDGCRENTNHENVNSNRIQKYHHYGNNSHNHHHHHNQNHHHHHHHSHHAHHHNMNKTMKNSSKLRKDRENLPVFAYKDKILETIRNNAITLIVGETGSGKTTQIPQYLLEWEEVTAERKIVCTQPRTVAATSVALRVCDELDCELASTVGFHIRLDRKITDGVTKLEYMTEGVLLRKAMNSNELQKYKVVIIDEAHERTVNADLLMGFLKEIVHRKDNEKNDLHLVVMSATLDTLRFNTYFDSPPIICIPGSLHPITHYWLDKPTDDYIKLTIDTILAIHNDKNAVHVDRDRQNKPDGHILVFLTGQQEIDNVVRSIRSIHAINPYYNFTLEVYPLYASLNSKDRQKAFDEPANPLTTRKCVIATNIAETSLTISNVVYVIDCGLSKQKVYSPAKGVEALGIREISKASVKQRIGRAGRVKPGKAYHLYTQAGYDQFPNETRAEILRSGLVSETLSMLALGMSNPLRFDFIDAPDELTMARAMNILYHLDAIDSNGKITSLGYKMAKFPVDPKMAKCLLMADSYHCVYEMAVIAAMLENVEKLWRRPKDEQKSDFRLKRRGFYHVCGDHLTLLNIYNAYKTKKLHDIHHIRQFCKSNYWDYATLERADQIKKQLEYILGEIKRREINANTQKGQCSAGGAENAVVFELNDHRNVDYYDNIIKCLLSGYFMNVAVQGFGGKYWIFRILTLDEVENVKTIDIIDKASSHPTSIFYKNNSRNWIVFHEIQISHTTQLRVITAIKPIWLIEANPKYYDMKSLTKDKSTIAKILIATATH